MRKMLGGTIYFKKLLYFVIPNMDDLYYDRGHCEKLKV
jgi:hypothetical protein